MAGIRVLDELMERLNSKKKLVKVPPNWLDKLRAKKGIPTGSTPDLGTFLLSEAKSNPPIPHFHDNSQNIPIRRRPRKQAHPTKRVIGCHNPSTSSSSTASEANPPQQQQATIVVDLFAHADPVAPADPIAVADLVAPARVNVPQILMVENPRHFRVNMIQPPFHPMEEDEEESDLTELEGINPAQMAFENQFDEDSDASMGDDTDESSDTSDASVISS